MQPALPFQGRSPQAKHASYSGAKRAQPKAGSQVARLLALLEAEGPLTRHQLAERLGLPVTSVCARVGWCQQQGLIEEAGLTKGPFGVWNTTYRRRR